MARARTYSCGVDLHLCSGAKKPVSSPDGHKSIIALHGSRREAFRCKVRSLIGLGYERIGPREFRPPDGGPILVLDKQSKFGSPFYYTSEKTRRVESKY